MANTLCRSEPALVSGETHVAFCNERVEMRPLRAMRGHRLACKGLRGRLLLLLSLSLTCLFPGCTVCHFANQTLRKEPSEFNWREDRKKSQETYRGWADQAWCQLRSADPGLQVSVDYMAGFKDGFVAYVYAGGTGQPPPVPPRKFWNVGFRNPRGQDSAADWFAGYRHGANVARAEGYRERVTIQSSFFLLGPEEDCSVDQPFATSTESLPLKFEMPERIEVLPTAEPPFAEPIAEELPLLQPPHPEESELEELESESAEPTDNELPGTPETPPQEFEDISRSSGSRKSGEPFFRRASMTTNVEPTPDASSQRRSKPRRHVSEGAWLRDMWNSLPEPGKNRRHRSLKRAKPAPSTTNRNFGQRTEPTHGKTQPGTIPRSEDNAESMFSSVPKNRGSRRASALTNMN